MGTGWGHEEQSWQLLSLLQSTDIVREKFHQKHARTLNLQRSREIATCFVQGAHYFMNARTASEIVNPLLLYYGVLSLSRGLILFLDPRKKEEALAPSHGLETADWQHTLSTGIDFTELGAKTTKGTFQELITATHNELVVHQSVLRMYGQDSIRRSKRLDIGGNNDGVIKLGDLLARTNELRNIYEQCTHKASSAIPCSVGTTSGHFNIQLGPYRNIDALKQRLQIPEGTNIGTWFWGPQQGNDPIPLTLTVPYGEDNDPSLFLPHLEPPEGATYLLEPWGNGGYLTPLLRYFVISYILGMLVRYFPSKWMYLFSYKKGDALLPLLQATVSNIETVFPKETAAYLGITI